MAITEDMRKTPTAALEAMLDLPPLHLYVMLEAVATAVRLFLKVNDVKDEKKAAVFITHLTDDSYRLLRNLAHPKEADELSYAELVKLFDGHFKPKKSTYADRARFYGATRNPGESLLDWSARLRELASYCDFGTALDTVLADRFVLGLGSGPERTKVFELSPSETKIGQALESAEKAACTREAKVMVMKEEPIYHASSHTAGGSRQRAGRAAAGQAGNAPRGQRGGGEASRCKVCGMISHSADTCRFKGYKCQRCGVKVQKRHLDQIRKYKGSDANVVGRSAPTPFVLGTESTNDPMNPDVRVLEPAPTTSICTSPSVVTFDPPVAPSPSSPTQETQSREHTDDVSSDLHDSSVNLPNDEGEELFEDASAEGNEVFKLVWRDGMCATLPPARLSNKPAFVKTVRVSFLIAYTSKTHFFKTLLLPLLPGK
ncbi:hypothetical protein NE865_01728 [Phthorimaea operculella]|nr:hypothetical protein NE865_01728 [Phthorimaea operculella]